MNEITLVSAATFEVQPTVEALKEAKIEVSTVELGVGAINAARHASVAAEQCRGRDVVFIGTCGSFANFNSPQIVTTRQVFWLPTAVRHGKAYLVNDAEPPYNLARPSGRFSQDLPVKTVICSPGISLEKGRVAEHTDAELVENLELYSVIEALDQVSRSICVLLCITNAIGRNAHAEWKAHYKTAATMTRDHILRCLR